jgi:hypothetical protein
MYLTQVKALKSKWNKLVHRLGEGFFEEITVPVVTEFNGGAYKLNFIKHHDEKMMMHEYIEITLPSGLSIKYGFSDFMFERGIRVLFNDSVVAEQTWLGLRWNYPNCDQFKGELKSFMSDFDAFYKAASKSVSERISE